MSQNKLEKALFEITNTLQVINKEDKEIIQKLQADREKILEELQYKDY